MNPSIIFHSQSPVRPVSLPVEVPSTEAAATLCQLGWQDAAQDRLGSEDATWLEKSIATGWKADIAETCRVCAECPDSFLGSPDFAFYAGFAVGRLTQIDRGLGRQSPEREKELAEAQAALYRRIHGCTGFDPAVFCCTLAFVPPVAVFGLLDDAVWPKPIFRLRPFYIGWFLGQWREGDSSASEIMALPGTLERVLDMLDAHRRQGASIFDALPELLGL